MNIRCGVLLLLLAAFPASVAAQGEMFARGRTHLALVGGNGYAFDNNYFVLGASASYFVMDGLGVGFSFENWSGATPGITKYAPYAQYVFYQTSAVQPYVGGFYRRTTIDGLPGIDSAGARAGVYIASGRNAYISAGVVHESYLDCEESVYRACRETYPDFTITVGF